MSSSEVDMIYTRMGDDLEQVQELGESNLQNFYSGKSVLFTGATGFMGKGFVEKILRCCPDLKKLYLIVRPKKGVLPQEKMKGYFQGYLFDRLRSMNPKFEDKVVTISGDLQEDRLGISEEDRNTLIEDVDIIVHNGATVKFDEIVSISLKINVLGTKDLLDLAMQCKHIQVFMYVSTAYSHCYLTDIEERFYEAPADLGMVYDIIKSDSTSKYGISEDALRMLLDKWPNVYTFTKAMAEDLVRQYGEKANFACGVYRPSIVLGAYKDPLVGWIGNKGGPTAMFIGAGLGLIHATFTLNHPMDLIPLDYSINSLIAATYDLPRQWAIEKQPRVYNYGSSIIAPVTLPKLLIYLQAESKIIGSTKIIWHVFFIFARTRFLFYICHTVFHFLPAILADVALLIIGKEPRALSIFFFATKHLEKIFYFSNGNWRIHVPKMMKVLDRLTPTDKALFPYDMTNFDWDDFIRWYTRGVRCYLMKESMDNVEAAKRHYHRMKALHYVTTTIFFLTLAYYAIRLFNCLLSIIF